MTTTCIALADASRARLFTLTRAVEVDGVHEQLRELRSFVNPARRQRPSELFADNGRGDDHRAAHIDDMDAGFARDVTSALIEVLRASGAGHLIVCASPRMLGELRAAGPELRRSGLAIDEVPRNLTKLTPSELRDQLASYGLLPQPASRSLEYRT